MQGGFDIVAFLAGMMAGAVLTFLFIVWLIVMGPWLKALLCRQHVTAMHILGMRLRRNRAGMLVDAYIQLRKQGRDITLTQVETIYVENKHRIVDLRDLIDRIEANL